MIISSTKQKESEQPHLKCYKILFQLWDCCFYGVLHIKWSMLLIYIFFNIFIQFLFKAEYDHSRDYIHECGQRKIFLQKCWFKFTTINKTFNIFHVHARHWLVSDKCSFLSHLIWFTNFLNSNFVFIYQLILFYL